MVIANSVVIAVSVPFDFEVVDQVFCYFEVVDQNGVNLQATQIDFDLSITDVNDNAPFFSQSIYSFNVTENLPQGQIIGAVQT